MCHTLVATGLATHTIQTMGTTHMVNSWNFKNKHPYSSFIRKSPSILVENPLRSDFTHLNHVCDEEINMLCLFVARCLNGSLVILVNYVAVDFITLRN